MKILELIWVDKYLSWKKVLNKVSFSVESGELYGFLWPNWAGKTTTMKTILWFMKEDSWTLKIFWESGLSIKSKKSIGFMPENTYLYKYLTWWEFLSFNWKFFWLEWEKLEKRVDELLSLVGLEDAKNKHLHSYSKWMLQRIWLAQSIINKPKLLFLDEPMSWLDPIWRKMVKDLLLDLKKSGTTIFFNTHILADVESICDKISIIHKWNIIVESKKVKDINWKLEDFFIEEIWKFEKKS